MARTGDITAETLRSVIHYDRDTGRFTWLVAAGSRRKVGEEAGHALKSRGGRRAISINGRAYGANRLAWLYVTGAWPVHVIDHINGDPSDDRFCNLRDVSQQINVQNLRAAPSHSGSGLLGAWWDKRHGKWKAGIKVNRKTINLGTFRSAEEAHAAYLAAKKRLHVGVFI